MSNSNDRRLDPLNTPTLPDRVFYAPGVLLDAEDFQAEQLYHRSRLARVLAYLHGSGTVAGLWVYREPPLEAGVEERFPEGREERLIVEPGLAIDRLGRLIEIPRAACLRLNRWFESQTNDDLVQGFHSEVGGVIVDVFIRFITCDRGKTPAFAAGPFDALDAVQPSRLRDGYELSLVIRPEANPPLPQSPWQVQPEAPPGESSTPPSQAQQRDQRARAIADPEARLQALRQNTLFDAWREGTDQWSKEGLRPLPEHISGQDPTDVFLARLMLPATETEGQIQRTEADPQIENYSRPFVYPSGALAIWFGLDTPPS